MATKEGSIKNNLDFSIQYMLLESKTQRNKYINLEPGESIQLTDENQYLVLRMKATDGFDFTEYNDRIHYIPVQFREGENEDGEWRVYVFEYTIHDDENDFVEGAKDGSVSPPQPPIPPDIPDA